MTLGRSNRQPTFDPVTELWACRRCREYRNSEPWAWCDPCEALVIDAARVRFNRNHDAIKPIQLNPELTRALLDTWEYVQQVAGSNGVNLTVDSTWSGTGPPPWDVDQTITLLAALSKVEHVLGPVLREVRDSEDAGRLYLEAEATRSRIRRSKRPRAKDK